MLRLLINMKVKCKVIVPETTEKPHPHATGTTTHVTSKTSSGTKQQNQLRFEFFDMVQTTSSGGTGGKFGKSYCYRTVLVIKLI